MGVIRWEETRRSTEWSGYVGQRRVFSLMKIMDRFHVFPDLLRPFPPTASDRKDITAKPWRLTRVEAEDYAEKVWAEFLDDVGAQMKES
jgi:hypothetical protein